MADYVEKFGFDVVGADDLKNKLNKALRDYGQTLDNVNKVSASFNKVGKANHVIIRGLNEQGKKFNATFKASGAVWKRLGFDIEKTTVSLTTAEKKFKAMVDSEKRAIAQRLKAQALTNREAADKFKSIQLSERLAAHNRQLAEDQKRLAGGFNRTGAAGRKAGQEILLSWTSVARLFIVQVLHQAIAQLRISFEQASRVALDFSKRVGEIRTISQEAGESTETWNKALLKQSDVFGLDLLDVTRAEYEALSNQIVDNSRQMSFLTESAKLAIITNSDLEVSVDAVSSVLNSFKLSTLDSARVSAVLFRTIDLGKTTMAELANNLGRTNALSRSLGVAFEEQQAALSTLTIQGLEDHTAKTLLNAVYQKLLRPTKQMSETFREWGVTSAQAAIQTYGLGEVLSRIVTQAEKSGNFAQELGESFQELRAITGIATLNLDVFREHLKENMDASGKYIQAFNIVNQSSGRQIQIQINKLKNLFIGFGTVINETFLSATKRFGDADQIIKAFLHTLLDVGLAFAIFKGVTLTVAAFTTTMSYARTAMLLYELGVSRATIATQAFGITSAGLATGGLAAIAFALAALINYQLRWRQRVEESVQAVAERFDKLNEIQVQSAIDKTKEWSDQFTKSSGSIFRRLSELNIAFQQRVNSMAQDLKKLNKAFVVNVNDIFAGQAKTLKGRITELQRIIKDADQDIDKIQKQVNGPGDIDKIKIQFRLDLEDGHLDKQVEIMRDAIRRTFIDIDRAKTLEEERTAYDRLVEVSKQYYDIVKQTGDRKLIVSAQKENLAYIEAQNRALERQRVIKEQEKAAAQQELLIQQQRLKEFEQNFKKLKTLNKDTSLADFDKIANSLDKAGQNSNLSVNDQLQLFNVIQQQRKLFQNNTVAKQQGDALATLRANAEAAQKIVQASKTDLEKQTADLQSTLTGNYAEFVKSIERLRATLLESGSEGAKVNETLRLFEEVRSGSKRIGIQQSQGDFVGIAKTVTDLQPKLRDLSRLFDELGFDVGGELYQDFNNLFNLFNGLTTKINEFSKAKFDTDRMEKFFNSTQEKLKQFSEIEASVSKNWQADQDDVNTRFERTQKLLNDSINQYERLRNTLGTPTGGEPVQNRHAGGRIGHYYSGGRGTDTQLAALTPGEYVWDRNTTTKMGPLIKGIHSMSKYEGGNNGGSSSYNFGDINVSGGGDAEVSANKIIRILKREIRRGNVKI